MCVREELLRQPQYFGQFGRIAKLTINRSGQCVFVGGWVIYKAAHRLTGAPFLRGSHNSGTNPSVGVYVTYTRPEEAADCVNGTHAIQLDGRTLRASLGTTKCAQGRVSCLSIMPAC